MTEQLTLDDTDPTFVADLMRSREAVERVTRALSARGLPVIVRPTFVRGSVAERGEFGDDGDLEIIQRVEVKRRHGLMFTGAANFPFASIIVDVCSSFDRARPKPYAYVILNGPMTVAAIVYVRQTMAQWTRVTKTDRHCNRERDYYECPIELVEWWNMAPEASAGDGP